VVVMIAAVRMTISTVQILDMTWNHALSSLSSQSWEVKNSLQIVFIVVLAMNSARSDRSRDQIIQHRRSAPQAPTKFKTSKPKP
jgi:UDP-N-acetyl-D-mannosaminuronic acid transferase (WecB/TagA/CpsF family)